jgi:hypothetical protein
LRCVEIARYEALDMIQGTPIPLSSLWSYRACIEGKFVEEHVLVDAVDQRLVHGLALTARTGPPIRDGPLVEPERRHNRLHRPPVGEQGHHDDHGLWPRCAADRKLSPCGR